jgi:uncharacterized protein YjbI with pentapeptide repeats
LQLLIIPLVLAIIALVFQLANSRTERQIARQRYEQDQQIALDKQREDLLQAYLDRLSELLLKEKLRSSEVDAEVRNVARVRTITVLTQLDARRVGYVFTFLREAGLMSPTSHFPPGDPRAIDKPKPSKIMSSEWGVVSLQGADLRAVNWSQADLSGAVLYQADLSRANLSRANLSNAVLSGANLNGANLNEADLSRAFFFDADLRGADLSGADLSGANLVEAEVTEEQLKEAKSLEGATMPDSTIPHPFPAVKW